jgi:geranylgeranyl diphosphate synthase type II
MYNHSKLKDIINRALLNLSYNTEAPKLIDPVKYILSIGGKRLRPVMALMACNLFTDKIDDAIFPATGLEIFHNFTLVHDDIMDHASVRRNFPTVHTKWNTNQAILSGDVMAFIANECILQSPPARLHKVFREFNKAAVEVCIGQQLDMDYEKAPLITQTEYLRMIELKTAALLAASMKIGALIGSDSEKDADLLYESGKNLGLAFQIQDDILDVWGEIKVFGKKSGGDIVANKKTFPYIKAIELASGEQMRQLQELFSPDREYNPETKVNAVKVIYEELYIREKTEALANDYISKAFELIDKVSVDDKRKKELICLTNSLIGREF